MPEYVWNITLKIRKVTLEVELLWKCLIWYYEHTVESEYALW